ncbi:MAG: hypothetical protein GXP42_16180 [Chloroflexi bacterium]|nr:hypothetical protein [Chloroflexota bacterium]
MQAIKQRYQFLFGSTKGLVLVAIAMISLETVFFGMLSGPMAELGIREPWVRLTGMQLHPAEREGRIIMLYHTIAMAVVAIEVYFITALVKMKREQQTNINAMVTVGYLVSMIFGMWFAYFGRNFIYHGLFIFGQSLVFFAGVMLAAALWPWNKAYYVRDTAYAHTRSGLDLERLAFFVMTVATLGSSIFGAVAGANFGNGFEVFLAEDVVREPHKSPLDLAVIGHLHIMLTLIAVALALIIGRWVDFKGRLHKWAMPAMIIGTVIVTLGVWAVVPFESIAHIIINVGSVFMLGASFLLIAFTWRQQIRLGLAKRGVSRAEAGFGQKLAALLHDPLPFGATWQMLFMNFVVTAVGVYMAINLDDVIREWPWREERITLTGHWHILAGIIGTIILLYYGDLAGLKGRVRQWFGWTIIIASDIAFAAVTLFSTKRLFVRESAQQPLVNWTMWLTDAGLFLVLVVLGALMAWRLIDLFKARGRWREEMAESTLQSLVKEVEP